MPALFLAEPEPELRVFLRRHLAADGFDVVEQAEVAKPALALVADVGVLETWRNRDVPVIVLADADADSVDCVRAFERGCDDFVPRPFVYDELLAFVQVIRDIPHRRCFRLPVFAGALAALFDAPPVGTSTMPMKFLKRAGAPRCDCS